MDKSEYKYGRIAAICYQDASKLHYKNRCEFEFADSLDRSLSLFLFLKDEVKVKELVFLHDEAIRNSASENMPYALNRLIGSILNKEKRLKDCDLKFSEYANLIRAYISGHQVPSEANYRTHRKLISNLLYFSTYRQDSNLKKNVVYEIGKAFENEGDFVNETRSSFIAGNLYEKALNEYQNSGCDNQLINKIKIKIRNSYNKAVDSEFEKVPILCSKSTKEIESALSVYLDKDICEILEILTLDSNGIVSYTYFKNEISEITHVINPFAIIPLKKGLKIKNVESRDELIKNQIVIKMIYEIDFNIRWFLDKIFGFLSKDYVSFANAIKKQMINSDFIDIERSEIIDHSITLYLKGDYLGSMHIIVFQIEAILRNILYFIEGETFTYRGKKMTELTLGTIISKLLEKNNIDHDLLRYLEINLTDQRGKNLRNDIAHGNMTIKQFSKLDNQLLIYLLLKVLRLKKHDL